MISLIGWDDGSQNGINNVRNENCVINFKPKRGIRSNTFLCSQNINFMSASTEQYDSVVKLVRKQSHINSVKETSYPLYPFCFQCILNRTMFFCDSFILQINGNTRPFDGCFMLSIAFCFDESNSNNHESTRGNRISSEHLLSLVGIILYG